VKEKVKVVAVIQWRTARWRGTEEMDS